MGKKKKNGGKRGGNRFFRWIRSELPDDDAGRGPVLLLGVNRFSESPSFVRRRSVERARPAGAGAGGRPPRGKYTRVGRGDERLERIRQDLHRHQQAPDRGRVGSGHEPSAEADGRCLQLNCAGRCDCDGKKDSSQRGSFTFHGPRAAPCAAEPCETRDQAEADIEFRFREAGGSPAGTPRRQLLLAGLNERLRKTLSLDSRKVARTAHTPAAAPPLDARPHSLVASSHLVHHLQPDELRLQRVDQAAQPKKKRKSFFSLDTFFDSKKSDSSSTDDYCSSKYKRFELESDDSPLFRRPDQRRPERTPDLLNLPAIIDSVRKKQSDTRRQLEKLESHYFRSIRTVVDAEPRDATSGVSSRVFLDDEEAEYMEPVGADSSARTSRSTLVLDKSGPEQPASASALTVFTDETDIRLPSSTVSPKSARARDGDADSIGAYEIEVKESDLAAGRGARLRVKAMDRSADKSMDKSVDSIGSCSLDVDASTDFSDTTSGSLTLLTPSSTADFTARLHDRAASGAPSAPASGAPSAPFASSLTITASTPSAPSVVSPSVSRVPASNAPDAPSAPSPLEPSSWRDSKKSEVLKFDNLLKPPTKVHSDSTSHKSRVSRRRTERSPPGPGASGPGAGGPSARYLQLACCAGGYSRLTAYDSRRLENSSLLVPVPVSSTRVLLPAPRAARHVTAPSPPAAPRPALAMADENKQLRDSFLGASTQQSPPTAAADEPDHAAFKYSRVTALNGRDVGSESYTISNGMSKRVEMTKENGEQLASPMKSFIQQRVERLYGPGALAQGFLMQKRQKKSTNEDDKVLTEKSLNCQSNSFVSPKKSTQSAECCSPEDDVSLPVLRHLRPEFRAQLPVLSPKKSYRTDTSPLKDIPSKTEGAPVSGAKVITDMNSANSGNETCSDKTGKDIVKLTNGVSVIEIAEPVNGSAGSASETNGEVVKDGHYFLELEKRETARLLALSASAEQELEKLQTDAAVSEETRGVLRSAAGKARLLATQKMQQFRGLCYNNVSEAPGAAFPTTNEDLQGFWDMLTLQLDQLDRLYAQLWARRDQGWREVSPPRAAPPPAGQGAGPASRRARSSPAASNEKARLAHDKREADRRAMLEHRRRVARERQLAARASAPGTSRERDHDMGIEGSQEVEIFVGKSGKPSPSAPQGDFSPDDS